MKYLFLIFLLISGCANDIYSIADYINENTEEIITVNNEKYTTHILSDYSNFTRRDILYKFPEIQEYMHNLVPDSERFYDVNILVPSENAWEIIKEIENKTSNPLAFTEQGIPVIIVLNPDYLENGSDKRQLQTAVHELMHHVSAELYNTMDLAHKRNELWGENGLVINITDELYNELYNNQ